MTQYQSDEKARLRRRWIEQAISLAMQNRWQDAVNTNRSILELFPNDVDALNRLGRALTELGQYADAKEAYGRAVEIDQTNTIAKRNLARLSTLSVEAAPVKAHEKVDPRIFVAETGKSGVTTLVRLARHDVLAKMTVGDQVYLDIEGRALLVSNANKETLGFVEPRLSQRVIDLMKGGNRYAAAIVSIDESQIRIIIRETYQDPSQAGKVSFPTKGGEASSERAYIKDSILRYEDEDEEETVEETDFEPEGAAEAEEAEGIDADDDADDYDDDEDEEEEEHNASRIIRPAAAAPKAPAKETTTQRGSGRSASSATRHNSAFRPLVAPLERLAKPDIVSNLSLDQEVFLRTDGSVIGVTTTDREYVGQIGQEVGQQLADLIHNGAQLKATIAALTPVQVRIGLNRD